MAQGVVTLRLRDSDQVAKILRHSPSPPSDVIFPETVTWYIMLVLMAIEREGGQESVGCGGVRTEGETEEVLGGGGAPLPSSTTKQT